MVRLLLVEDDSGLGETLQERLQKEGYYVDWVDSLKKAEKTFSPGAYDLILLDVTLGDGTGFEFARQVRAVSETPFVFLSAMTSAEYRLQGYEIGAEEYIPKPFHLKELLLRVRHVLSTHRPAPITVCQGKSIDFESMAIIDEHGEKTYPAARDFRLLEYLIRTAPRVVSRDEILEKLWGEDHFPSNRTIDNAIVRLRQTLDDRQGQFIRSVRGVGYQWVGEKNE